MKTLKAKNSILNGKEEVRPGGVFNMDDDKEAQRLIDCGAAEEVATTPAPIAPERLNAKDTIALIGTCETIEAVDVKIKDEVRKSVLEAAEAKKKELAGGKE